MQQAGNWLSSVSLQPLFMAEQGDTDGKERAALPRLPCLKHVTEGKELLTKGRPYPFNIFTNSI